VGGVCVGSLGRPPYSEPCYKSTPSRWDPLVHQINSLQFNYLACKISRPLPGSMSISQHPHVCLVSLSAVFSTIALPAAGRKSTSWELTMNLTATVAPWNRLNYGDYLAYKVSQPVNEASRFSEHHSIPTFIWCFDTFPQFPGQLVVHPLEVFLLAYSTPERPRRFLSGNYLQTNAPELRKRGLCRPRSARRTTL